MKRCSITVGSTIMIHRVSRQQQKRKLSTSSMGNNIWFVVARQMNVRITILILLIIVLQHNYVLSIHSIVQQRNKEVIIVARIRDLIPTNNKNNNKLLSLLPSSGLFGITTKKTKRQGSILWRRQQEYKTKNHRNNNKHSMNVVSKLLQYRGGATSKTTTTTTTKSSTTKKSKSKSAKIVVGKKQQQQPKQRKLSQTQSHQQKQQPQEQQQQQQQQSTTKASKGRTPFGMLAYSIQSILRQQQSSNTNANTGGVEIKAILEAFGSLSVSQRTFKGLDGAAHVAYQKIASSSSSTSSTTTKSGPDDPTDITSVAGRAVRNAARTGAVADALFACELCDLIERPIIFRSPHEHKTNDTSTTTQDNLLDPRNGTLADRIVVVNATNVTVVGTSGIGINVLLLYEPNYNRGSGIHHGGIHDLQSFETDDVDDGYNQQPTTASEDTKSKIKSQGRLLIIIQDTAGNDLETIVQLLYNQPPKHVSLYSKQLTKTDEIASVQNSLHKAASAILQFVEPQLRQYTSTTNNKIDDEDDENTETATSVIANETVATSTTTTTTTSNSKTDNPTGTTAIHFVGRSLGGGIAALAASILHGDIPLEASFSKKVTTKKKKTSKKSLSGKAFTRNPPVEETAANTTTARNEEVIVRPLQGLGKDRTSACIIGPPPCLSPNVVTDYITSIVYGDDIITRLSYDSIQRFVQRVQRAMSLQKNILLIGKQLNWMTDTVTLALSNLQSHAVGSDGEEIKLGIPGRSYLIRPRQLGNRCSIHEVGPILLKGGREALRAAVLWQLHDVVLTTSLWKHHQLESYIYGLDSIPLRGLNTNDNDENNNNNKEEEEE